MNQPYLFQPILQPEEPSHIYKHTIHPDPLICTPPPHLPFLLNTQFAHPPLLISLILLTSSSPIGPGALGLALGATSAPSSRPRSYRYRYPCACAEQPPPVQSRGGQKQVWIWRETMRDALVAERGKRRVRFEARDCAEEGRWRGIFGVGWVGW